MVVSRSPSGTRLVNRNDCGGYLDTTRSHRGRLVPGWVTGLSRPASCGRDLKTSSCHTHWPPSKHAITGAHINMAPSSSTSAEASLKSLIARPPSSITVGDVRLLANSLVHTATRPQRSLATVALSKLAGTADLAIITPSVKAYLDETFLDDADEPTHYLPLAALLTGLFSVASPAASSLLTSKITRNGAEEEDVLGVLLESAELASPLQSAFAELLSQVASTKQGRDVVKRAEDWLRGALHYGDSGLGALCAAALSKIGPGEPEPGADVDTSAVKAGEMGLAKKMMDHITAATGPPSALLPTLEGLSILTTKPHVKHLVASSTLFLKALFKLSPVPDARPSSLPVTPRGSIEIDEKIFEPVEASLCYGICTILVNITTRKPILSAEDEQIAKLRAMAISGKKGAKVEEDPFDSDEAVEERVAHVVQAGIMPALRGLVRAESTLVKEALGRLCLNLVYDKVHRPVFVRDGGFRVLSQVVRDLMTPKSPTGAKKTAEQKEEGTLDYLPACQALAKLVITTPPHLLFPPPHLTTSLNALSPLYHLLVHPSSTLLQTFEALMALTNLASVDPSIANRIVDATATPPVHDAMWRGAGRDDTVKVISRVEELLLDSNPLVRRAATELVCNLVNCSAGHVYFAGESDVEISARVKSRLNVLLVLTSVDDTPTRLAAGGALAILSETPSAAAALFSIKDEPARTVWTRVLGLFEPDVPGLDEDGEEIPVISSAPPTPELVHRGVIILLNLLEYAEKGNVRDRQIARAREAGVETKLLEAIRREKAREILEPAVEALKLFKRYPAP